jgi:hypothetical protein
MQTKKNEIINEFVVRLRALLQEIKPNENEQDLIKRLLCKMRSDILNMLGVSQSNSFDRIIEEARKVEAILFLREKEHRQHDREPQPTTQSQHLYSNRNLDSRYNANQTYCMSSHSNNNRRQRTYANNSYNSFSSNTNTQNRNRQYPRQTSAPLNQNETIHDRSSIICYRCNQPGHYQNECQFSNYSNELAQSFQRKND